jgi:hypothetical protein
MEQESTSPAPDPAQLTSFSGCFIRIVWMLGGTLLAFVGLVLVVIEAATGGRWAGPSDIVFAAAVLLAVAARSIDHPALKPSRKRFAAAMLGGAAALWLAVHGAATLLR